MHFLSKLASSGRWSLSVSCGDPQRIKNYRAAIFGNQKSDPIEARAAARYALTERPRPFTPLPDALRDLRQIHLGDKRGRSSFLRSAREKSCVPFSFPC
jgi:hypothetical protein